MDIAGPRPDTAHEAEIAVHEANYRSFLRVIRTAAVVVAFVLLGLTLLV